MDELSTQDEQIDTQPKEDRIGIIRVSAAALAALDITIEHTDTQGKLRETGVFKQLHERLLLPASYSILAGYFTPWKRIWDICVESPDLPLTVEGLEAPALTPWYNRFIREDGTVYSCSLYGHVFQCPPNRPSLTSVDETTSR